MVIISNSIFEKKLNIGDNDLAYLCEYIPFYSEIRQDKRSENFVLGFKKKHTESLNKAYEMIVPNLGYDFCIAVVPPSTSNEERTFNSACHKLAAMIINRIGTKHRITDASYVLQRIKDIDSAHNGARRNLGIHYDSIKCNRPERIKGRDVLLLDDIYTTGTSMQACSDILKEQGARSVTFLAIGRTLNFNYQDIKYGIIFDLDQTLYDTLKIKPYRDNHNWSKAMEMAERIKYSPYDGVNQFLNWIKYYPSNFDVCMLTSAHREYASIFANALGITKVVVKNHKPYLEPYLEAKQLLGIYEKCITVVGNTTDYIIPGKKLSMNTVLIAPQYDGIADFHFTSFKNFVENKNTVVLEAIKKRLFYNY